MNLIPAFASDDQGHLRPHTVDAVEQQIQTLALARVAEGHLWDCVLAATPQTRTAAVTAHLIAKAIVSEVDPFRFEAPIAIPSGAAPYLPETCEWLNAEYQGALASRDMLRASGIDFIRQVVGAVTLDEGVEL